MAENVAALAPEYRALQDAFERLQKKISPGGIIGALYSRNLLLLNEADTIRSKVATLEKNEELLFAISRRSPAQVLQFCQFLLGEQCHCGNILKEALQARGVDTSSLTVATLETSAVSHVAAKYYPQIDDLDVALAALVQKIKDGTKNSKNLKTYCIRFLTTLSRIHSHDTKDVLDRLATPDCQNEEAIDIVQRFVDPLDCRLLYKIVSALEDEQLSKAWDDYCQSSKQACCVTLEQCRKVAIRPHQSPPNCITVGMQTKISPPDITIQKILQLKEFLITKVGLEASVFQGFACSAVALFFTIGRKCLAFLVRLLSCHQKALLDFSIITVFVPGEFFYDVAKDQEYPCPKDEKVQESVGTQEQASSFADVESRFSAALERIEHVQMAVQKKEELMHMERKEVEKERLQNQVQSLVHDNLKLQDENHLLEKRLLQRLDALQEMMGKGAETQPQGEEEVPEKDLCMVDVEATGDVVESDWESESKSKWSEAPLKKSKLQELEPEEKEDIGEVLSQPSLLPSLGKEMRSIKIPDMPKAAQSASAIIHKNKVFIRAMYIDIFGKQIRPIFVYSTNELKWSTLPEHQDASSIAVVNDRITLIGGREVSTRKVTNVLSTCYEEKGQWKQVLPPMPTGRVRPAVISHDNLLLVTGGVAEDDSTVLNTTSVLDLTTMKWITPEGLNLPVPLWLHHLALCGEYLYLVGGATVFPWFCRPPDNSNSQAWRAKWSDVKQTAIPQHSQPQKSVWTRIADPPTLGPTAVSCGGTLYTVCGVTRDEKFISTVYTYITARNQWVAVGDMTEGRIWHCAVSLSSTSMLVAGGLVQNDGKLSFCKLAELILL